MIDRYPWFERQRKLYPFIRFPKVKADASTSIHSEYAHCMCVFPREQGSPACLPAPHSPSPAPRPYKRDLVALMHSTLMSGQFPGGVFLDLQAIVRVPFAARRPFPLRVHFSLRLCMAG